MIQILEKSKANLQRSGRASAEQLILNLLGEIKHQVRWSQHWGRPRTFNSLRRTRVYEGY
jgi:hypothetical protein